MGRWEEAVQGGCPTRGGKEKDHRPVIGQADNGAESLEKGEETAEIGIQKVEEEHKGCHSSRADEENAGGRTGG